jgi:hypothetical protein
MTIFRIWKVFFDHFALAFFFEMQRHSGWPCFSLVLYDSLTSAQIYSASTYDTGWREKEGKDG